MFKSISKLSLFAILLSLGISGCVQAEKSQLEVSNLNQDVLREYKKVQITKEHLEVAADKQKNVTSQNTLESTIASLATQMMQNQRMDTNKPVIITSFVRLDAFKKTTEFGRIIGESLINELSNREFNIIEFRGQMAVSINDNGEFFMTRKIQKIKGKIPNTYVVVGTYSRLYGKVMLNARVIDNITGKIITTARSTFHHGKRSDCFMFNDCRPARTINIIKE